MLTGKEKSRIEKSFNDFYYGTVVRVLLTPTGLYRYSLNLGDRKDCEEYNGDISCPPHISDNIINENFSKIRDLIVAAQNNLSTFDSVASDVVSKIEWDAKDRDRECRSCRYSRHREETSMLAQLVSVHKEPGWIFYTPNDLTYLIFLSLSDKEAKARVCEGGSIEVMERRLKNIRRKYPKLYKSLTREVKGLHGHITTVYHEGIFLLILKELEAIRLSRFKNPEQHAYWNELSLNFLKELECFVGSRNIEKFGDLWLLREYLKSKRKELTPEEPEIDM